jgi:hypothetical protein
MDSNRRATLFNNEVLASPQELLRRIPIGAARSGGPGDIPGLAALISTFWNEENDCFWRDAEVSERALHFR